MADIANRPAEAVVVENAPVDPGQSLTPDEQLLEPPEGSEVAPMSVAPGDDLAFQELSWDDLLPADFDFNTLRDQIDLESYEIYDLTDDDPEAQRLYSDLQSVMADVPMVEALDGVEARIPGFLVPLEMAADEVREFFLVPYYGACIHSPPPPANQIVHVVLDEPVAFDNMFEPYWARGTIDVISTNTDIGTAGYRLNVASISPYE
ncbi:DUF3299 domain-containing protein [Saccharospirillum impatiens]|uniref:DUF3299 domain-containing protein n=1 Tax=Saccharospirillum impatiens TaxID=169438 RepID=UPI0004294E55|nr:DUF3299 domain-containing protein [Saccharospirillum impatiens]